MAWPAAFVTVAAVRSRRSVLHMSFRVSQLFEATASAEPATTGALGSGVLAIPGAVGSPEQAASAQAASNGPRDSHDWYRIHPPCRSQSRTLTRTWHHWTGVRGMGRAGA